jgi:hypothetical protein
VKPKSIFTRIVRRMWRSLSGVFDRCILVTYRLRFHLFFKNRLADGEYCNSRRIRVDKQLAADRKNRPYLAIIRCGAKHCLVDDGSQRNFDIALNLYAPPDTKQLLEDCEYLYRGGINKYKAAWQFIGGVLLAKYKGFIFLDDDLEITYSNLSRFLEYCSAHGFGLAQPSISTDSSYSHKHLVNVSPTGWRRVGLVEVMCPYFSNDALRVVLNTFDRSYSTWGLDFLWPRLLAFEPVVVDDFTIKHTKPVGGSDSAFYRYMRRIGISPQRESRKLRNTSESKLRLWQGRLD